MTDEYVQEGGVWGRIVIASAFAIQVIVFGTTQSIGVYNIEFVKEFDSGAAAISLVGSINLGIFCVTGPVCGLLLTKMSHRQVALIGATLPNIGLVCMPFATSLPYMYVFYGLLTGFGLSLVYMSSLVLCGLYYTRHRGRSTGLATAGSGFGVAVFPIIIYNLIQHYGWRGSLVILAGLNLHLFILAALLRPMSKPFVESFQVRGKCIARTEKCSNNTCYSNTKNGNEDISKRVSCIEINDTNVCSHKDIEAVTGEIDAIENKVISIDPDELNSVRHNAKNGEHIHDVNGNDITQMNCIENDTVQCVNGKRMYVCTRGDSLMFDHTPGTYNTGTPTKLSSKFQKLIPHLKTVFTFDFSIFWLSNICWNAGLGIVLIFIPKYMTTVGLAEESASIALSIFGAGKCLGCIVAVALGNKRHCNINVLYMGANIGAGISTLLILVSNFQTFVGLVSVISISGLMVGVILGLLVVMTSDLLGTKVLGYGFGYLILANGIGFFCGPPIAGVLIDTFGHEDVAIYVSGCCSLFAGLVFALVPFCSACRNITRNSTRVSQ